jgi:DNA-binding transcriptional MerR regulator
VSRKKQKRNRRWFRVPEARLQELRRLLLETYLPIEACLQRAGIPSRGNNADRVIKECRRHVRHGQWMNRVTGKLCPPDVCTAACAADKTGLSEKTIRRHVERGFVQPGNTPSNQALKVFSEDDVALLAEIGRLKPGTSVLSAEDVAAIRKLAAAGRTARDIRKRYPVVTLKQIRRIISGERWRKLA